MPSLPAARREQSPPPPAKRNRWDCPHCGAHGWGQNAKAAETAGVRHWLEQHSASTARKD